MQKSRTNNQIRVPEVRVIDETGAQLGIMRTQEALAIAQERGLDMVEVSPLAKPPVVKFIDFDKFRYHQKKLEQQQKKKVKKIQVKGIRLSLRISEHDLQIKAKQTQKFLDEGHKAQVSLMMRGREQAFADQGYAVVKKFLSFIPNHEIEAPAKKAGNTISAVIKQGKVVSNNAKNENS